MTKAEIALQDSQQRVLMAVEDTIKQLQLDKNSVFHLKEIIAIGKRWLKSSEEMIELRQALEDNEKVVIFKEGDTMDDHKYYYSKGSWIALTGVYDNPIQAKRKLGLASWQESKDDSPL